MIAIVACAACSDPGPAPSQPQPDEPYRMEAASGAENSVVALPSPASSTNPTPEAPRFIHAEAAEALAAASLGLREIKEALGYALAPKVLPVGFLPTVVRTVDFPGRPMATLFYENSHMRLAIFYPAQFAPISDPLAQRAIFSPPADAVVRVVVNEELAYLMRGEWDDRTVHLLASYTAQWEYNGRLTLFFPYEGPEGHGEWAMLSANTQREGWIDVTNLIAIAESVGPVP